MHIDINQPLNKKTLSEPIKYYRSSVDTAFPIDITLQEFLDILRGKKIKKDVYYFYAVDHENHLYGVFSTRDILFNSPDLRIKDIVNEDIVSLHEDVTVEHALKVLEDHHFLSMPVVDDEYRLIGVFEIVPADINFSYRYKHRPSKETQNVFQIIGFTVEKSKMDSKWAEYRYRMPWLIGNLFSGFICAAIASYYQATLAVAVVLSMFIPLALTLSESVSMQSMTISLQFLSYRKVLWKEIGQRLIHEGYVSIFLGLTSGLLLFVYYMIGYDSDWHPDLPVISIALSIVLSMIIAASFGTLFPLLLHKLKLDPKVAAGPIVLMLTDIMATAIYFSLAAWLLLS